MWFYFCFAAICGAAIVYGLTPEKAIDSLGVTAPGTDVTTMQAFGVELGLTFILMFLVMAVTDPARGMTGYGVPLAIGICVFVCLMQGVSINYDPLHKYANSSLNGDHNKQINSVTTTTTASVTPRSLEIAFYLLQPLQTLETWNTRIFTFFKSTSCQS